MRYAWQRWTMGRGGDYLDSVSECGCECKKCTWRIDVTSHCSLSRVGIYSIIHAIQEIYSNEIGNAQSRRARGVVLLYFGVGLDVAYNFPSTRSNLPASESRRGFIWERTGLKKLFVVATKRRSGDLLRLGGKSYFRLSVSPAL